VKKKRRAQIFSIFELRDTEDGVRRGAPFLGLVEGGPQKKTSLGLESSACLGLKVNTLQQEASIH